MIDFSLTPEEEEAIRTAHRESVEVLRPLSRYYDEHEHEDRQHPRTAEQQVDLARC